MDGDEPSIHWMDGSLSSIDAPLILLSKPAEEITIHEYIGEEFNQQSWVNIFLKHKALVNFKLLATHVAGRAPTTNDTWKRSGSVVECLTRDPGDVGSSLT